MSNSTSPGSRSKRSDISRWRDLVAQSLREKSIGSIAATSDDGLVIGPVHGAPQASATFGTRQPNHPWVVVQRLEFADVPRASTSLAADLAGGAAGIELVFAGSASAERAGFGIEKVDERLITALSQSEELHLRLDAGESTWLIFERLRNLRFADLTFACDSLAHASQRGGFDRPLSAIESGIVASVARLEAKDQAGTVAEADGRVWAAGGASEAQELAGILGSLAHHARLLIGAGLPAATAFRRIGITVDAGPNQLMTLAKLRAVRLLHGRLAEAFGVAPAQARIHAETSWRMMSRRDPHTNILRTASAAFAAGIGGADSITILPFTVALGLPDAFARRVARNQQAVLIEEAGLARVGDPGAGSGAIEALTAGLAEAAWEKFRAIEAQGGLLAALRSGSFQRDVAAMREKRADGIARRQTALTGVSEFPPLDEAKVSVLAPRPRAPERQPAAAEGFDPLPAMRLAEPFEALRDRADALAAAGRMLRVFLADLGSVADHAGAAQAARNFFAIAGIPAVDGRGFATPEAAATAFAASDSRICCIVGAAETLETLAVPTAAALKRQGAERIYLMGGTAGSEDIDAVLGEDVNVLAILDQVLNSIA